MGSMRMRMDDSRSDPRAGGAVRVPVGVAIGTVAMAVTVAAAVLLAAAGIVMVAVFGLLLAMAVTVVCAAHSRGNASR